MNLIKLYNYTIIIVNEYYILLAESEFIEIIVNSKVT